MKKVAVGLSGGVDSAVTAAGLLEQGYEVVGVFLECWREPGCRVDEDRRDAMDVAKKIGIEFKMLDFREEYKKKVVDYFFQEYQAGRTPNPDAMCNREIKFGMFYEWAMENNFDFIATGHYARIRRILEETRYKGQETRKLQRTNSKYQLLRGVDEKKDQSYFLYQLKGEQLEHVLFPLGEMTKEEVREKAKLLGLSVADKPDSQGICFIGQVSVVDFLKDLGMEEKQGPVFLRVKRNKSNIKKTNQSEVIEEDLIEIGEHIGAWFYTVGQRHGFKIQNSKIKGRDIKMNPEKMPPLYVIDKDVEGNALMVGARDQVMSREFEVGEIHWVNQGDSVASLQNDKVVVRIRHGGRLISSKFEIRNSNLLVHLDESVFGVASGQVCVFYDGEVVLGGGVICG